MSRSRSKSSDRGSNQGSVGILPVGGCCGFGNCTSSLPALVILILILLQFSRRRGSSGGGSGIDNSILFIIALFYLSCCNPCKRGFGVY
ncbi:MAG: hypothetical protein Q8936_20275 [Bacillota bacterium]|nr:hypothetical protein [Bacillota bacterium]